MTPETLTWIIAISSSLVLFGIYFIENQRHHSPFTRSIAKTYYKFRLSRFLETSYKDIKIRYPDVSVWGFEKAFSDFRDKKEAIKRNKKNDKKYKKNADKQKKLENQRIIDKKMLDELNVLYR